MDYEIMNNLLTRKNSYVIQELSKTRPQEIIIITLLIITIGIGAAILINQRKIKKQLRELLDQKKELQN